MSNNVVLREDLDVDAVVDGTKHKVRFLSVIDGTGAPTDPPSVPEKVWIYVDRTPDPAALYAWDPNTELWDTAGGGNGLDPRIIRFMGIFDTNIPTPTASDSLSVMGITDLASAANSGLRPGGLINLINQSDPSQNGAYTLNSLGTGLDGPVVPILVSGNAGCLVWCDFRGGAGGSISPAIAVISEAGHAGTFDYSDWVTVGGAPASTVASVNMIWMAPGDAVVTGDRQFAYVVPDKLDGATITSVHCGTFGPGTGTTSVQLELNTADVLSTNSTIDTGEATSYTAATPSVVDGAHSLVAKGDIIVVDVDGVATGATGLQVIVTFTTVV